MFDFLTSILLIIMTYQSNKLKERVTELEDGKHEFELMKENLRMLYYEVFGDHTEEFYEENDESV